jgi:ankyrin repeat protein
MAIEKFPIHAAATAGDLELLRRLIAEAGHRVVEKMELLTPEGYSALMCAAASSRANAEVMRVLLAAGAAAKRTSRDTLGLAISALSLALNDGDPAKVAALLDAGARLDDLRQGHSALLHAVHGRDVHADPRLLDLLRLLIERGADLDFESEYRETGLRVLSRLGRFDGVKLLLEAGADSRQLAWNPLLRAIAIGTLDDVRRELDGGADPEERDFWERTAWLMAISAGNLDAAKLLIEQHVDIDARGRCSKPALFYAIETHNLAMFQWLLSLGLDPAVTDQFGQAPLTTACEHDDLAIVDALIAAGVDVEVSSGIYAPLGSATSARVAQRLLQAGADPSTLTEETRRLFLGLPQAPSIHLLDVTDDDFRRGAARRFGRDNPEEFHEPFWTAMVRAGVDAYTGAKAFKAVKAGHPVWCAKRFGQSLTFLPDGRVVQIAGEHEDSYDPDFCIYNDVFVHDRGSIRIFGYPEDVFPPTDFHTATLIDGKIWIVGSLGYHGARRHGTTPVYTLDTGTWAIEAVPTTGPAPGWIYSHRADVGAGNEIIVYGGKLATEVDGEETHGACVARHALDTKTLRWRICL